MKNNTPEVRPPTEGLGDTWKATDAHKPHDRGRRALFRHPELIRDLLLGYVHEPWVRELDFSTLEKLPSGFLTPAFHDRVGDVVWSVRWRDRELFLLVLVEFQSTDDRHMAVRQLLYVALLYEEIVRRKRLLPDSGLPPALPIVLYNGEREWRSACCVSELLGDLPDELDLYQPRLRSLLLDESKMRVDLGGTPNLMSAVAALEQSRTPEALRDAVRALARWLGDDDGALRRTFVAWIQNILEPSRSPGAPIDEVDDLEEIRDMLEERVKQWQQGWLAEGREEGRQEGREEGRSEGRRLGEAEVLMRQIQLKFGKPSDAVLARIDAAESDDLLRWADRILTATSIEDVLGG